MAPLMYSIGEPSILTLFIHLTYLLCSALDSFATTGTATGGTASATLGTQFSTTAIGGIRIGMVGQ